MTVLAKKESQSMGVQLSMSLINKDNSVKMSIRAKMQDTSS